MDDFAPLFGYMTRGMYLEMKKLRGWFVTPERTRTRTVPVTIVPGHYDKEKLYEAIKNLKQP